MTSHDRARLTDAELEVVLSPCKCGHTINDHGSLATCWTCGDAGSDDCESHFEDLLVERIDAILTARLAELEAQLAAARSALAAVREVRQANR